jgi:predicted kinase
VSRFLLQMAGVTGTGKSTLASAIAERTGAVVVDKDVIMAGALSAGTEPSKVGALAYEIGFALGEAILRAGHDVILDSPANFTMIRDKGAQIACRTGARYYIVECIVPELAVAERRIASREPLHLLHPTSFESLDMDFSRPGTGPLTEPHTRIDTTQPLLVCLNQALDYIVHDQG